LFVQNFGKIIINPKIVIILPENQDQNKFGISINRVDAFSSSVNKITETASAKITLTDFEDISLPFSTELDPIIIGRRGSTHGASIVKTPARIAMKKNNI